MALKFVLHFMGDVHQPLHAADHNDQGGNQVKVLFGEHRAAQKLHAFWDTETVNRIGPTPNAVAKAAERTFGSHCHSWMTGTQVDWAWESFGIARDFAYKLGDAQVPDEHGELAF